VKAHRKIISNIVVFSDFHAFTNLAAKGGNLTTDNVKERALNQR
jgi:hypothetical protein